MTNAGSLTSNPGQGRFRILGPLGHGGCAQVFLAVAGGVAGFHKLVVLKQPLPEFLENAEGREMFLNEARIAARFSHPNVVQTHEVIASDPPCIVMEYLEGCSLAGLAKKAGSELTLEMHCRIISDALVGLHHVHVMTDFNGAPLGLVHRDANPQNIFVTFDGQVKILDFGVAKIGNAVHTGAGVVKGKIRYMPPEQFVGENVDRRADIFAAGVMLWEAATGLRMWTGMSDYAVMQALVEGKIASPRAVRSKVPEALDRICMRALAIDREGRYETAEEMASALDTYIESTGHRVGSREISRVASSAFAQERSVTRKLIERHLAQSDSASSSDPLFLPEPATSSSAVSSPQPPSQRSTTSQGVTKPAFDAEGADSSAKASPVWSIRAGSRPVLAACALLAVVTALLFGRRVATKPTPGPSPAGSLAGNVPSDTVGGTLPVEAPLAPSTPTPVVKEVHLTVSATPSQARVYVDEVAAPTNPFSRTASADGMHHSIRGTAPGYATVQKDVVLDRDVEIVLVLPRIEPVGRGAAASVPQGSHSAKTSAPAFVNEL